MRNTSTGGVLEAMVLPALKNGGYSCTVQVKVGKRLSGGNHFVDVVAEQDGRKLLISMKWQQVSGTAEQKVPYEVICLLEALEDAQYSKAYLVLGGEGWTLRSYFIGDGLKKFLAYADKVEIVTLEGFVGRANAGKL